MPIGVSEVKFFEKSPEKKCRSIGILKKVEKITGPPLGESQNEPVEDFLEERPGGIFPGEINGRIPKNLRNSCV